MVAVPTPVEIFCSYAHEDEAWLRKLETHLSLLKRQGLVFLWHDRLIVPGTDWVKTIDIHLETASVILLLVSADFFASDYCYGIEMQRAIARHEAGEARVVPLLVRPVDWKDAPFAHLYALPPDARPLSTWQDEDTAFTNVTAGIRRVLEDLSLLAASAPRADLPKVWNIPYPRNPFFLGRDDELAQLRRHLQAGQATPLAQPQAISGLGGIGKTQLALEYAYRYHQDYQAVLWARAESTEALISSYIAVATVLRLPECGAKEQNITVQAVKTWLQTHRGWLLILDNADDLTLLPNFLPPSLGGHLLLTTQARATGRLAHRLEIETLQPEQGALFLLRRSGCLASDAELSQISSQEQELALQISQEMGGLPLALDQAGAYIEETQCGLNQYLQRYRTRRSVLLQRRGGLAPDHPEPVAATWSLSFEKVEQVNPTAADLLRLCAFLHPDAIPEEIITQGAAYLGPHLSPIEKDPLLLDEAIAALGAYSLLHRDTSDTTLTIHRLVQVVLQDTLEEAERRIWAERAMLAVNATFPDVKPDTWPQCERLLPQVLTVAHVIEQYQIRSSEAGKLLYRTAWYLSERARYREAESVYLLALAIQEHPPDVAITLNGLAIVYFYQGKYTEAEPLCQRALHIWEQLELNHPERANPLASLAMLYHTQGKYAEAEPLYQQALRIQELQLGPEHLTVTLTQNNLALLYYEQGRYTEAEPLFQRVLYLREQRLEPDHPLVASVLNNLSILYKDQGKYAEAEPLSQQALHIQERRFGPEHPHVAYPLNNLANVYSEQGKYAEAESLYQRALHIREQQLGPEHLQVTYPLHGLADLYFMQGKYAEAESLYQRALRIREQLSEANHPAIAPLLTGLANVYLEQGKHAEAELLLQKALLNVQRSLGEHPQPQMAYPLFRLADLYSRQGKYAEAESLYQRALHSCEQLGLEHPDVAYPLYGMATLYRDQSKYAEAELLYQRALHIREQSSGRAHPITAEIMDGIARLREAQSDREEARSLYTRALATREQVLGTHHPKTTETRQRLIALLHAIGQHEEAAKLEVAQPES